MWPMPGSIGILVPGIAMGASYLCNLVIPGAAKSGTSSLHDVLHRHPEISMSTPKEPQHFSFPDRYARGAEYHNALFERAASIRWYGESSQCYMVHEQALERIRQDLDSPKAILLLRHPVERLLSHYRWNYKLGVEKKPLMVAIDSRGDDVSYAPDSQVGMYRERGGYLAFSRYSRWIPLWRDALGAENVLVLRTEDLRVDQEMVAQRCFRFLGLGAYNVGQAIRKNSTDKTIRLLPRPVYIATRFVPARIKRLPAYGKMLSRLRSALTRTPPSSLSETENALITTALAADIAFYDALDANIN